MPKEYFTIARATALESIAPGSKVHVSGVCGVAMAQLAVELSCRGFEVSGSDKEFYEPMGSFLRSSKVALHEGYKAENIPSDVALVVIGNALSYENSEVQEVERRTIPYSFFPKLFFDAVIRGKHSIVVSGTHGKSTTTALIAWLLTRINYNPGFFVGAAIPGFSTSLVSGDGAYSVTEGDEYDSCFFAKVPKFTFYRPDTLIITAIEFDHADIYSSLDQIEGEFSKLVLNLDSNARLICCVDCKNVQRLVTEWRSKAKCQVTTYGIYEEADVRLTKHQVENGTQYCTATLRGGTEINFELKIPGTHNALNATAALMACKLNNMPMPAVLAALPTFGGTRRRQEIRYNQNQVTLIDDFAHHPTAVRETIAAIRSFYLGRRLWAIFEPRSNTSRRKVFQNDYVDALKTADTVVLCDVVTRASDAGQELIKVDALSRAISDSGTPAVTMPNADGVREYLLQHVQKGDVFLVMSNGAFGGLVEKLERDLMSRNT